MWRGPAGNATALPPNGFPMVPADRLHDGSSADPWHGGNNHPPPPTQPPLSQMWGALLSPFLQTIPAAPRSPGSCFLQPFTRLSHRAPSRQAQLQGQSAWSICSGTVSSPPARPQHGRTACCHAAGTAVMEIGEWERSQCCRGQEEGKCPGKGTARLSKVPPKSPASPDLERSCK